MTFRNLKLLPQSGCCLMVFFSPPSLHLHPMTADQVGPVQVTARNCCPNSKRLVQAASQLHGLCCHRCEPHFETKGRIHKLSVLSLLGIHMAVFLLCGGREPDFTRCAALSRLMVGCRCFLFPCLAKDQIKTK